MNSRRRTYNLLNLLGGSGMRILGEFNSDRVRNGDTFNYTEPNPGMTEFIIAKCDENTSFGVENVELSDNNSIFTLSCDSGTATFTVNSGISYIENVQKIYIIECEVAY